MEPDFNNTTQHSIDIQTPLDTKVKRRSSIFRQKPVALETSTSPNYGSEKLNQEYLDQLKGEIVSWKTFYAKIKAEYKQTRSLNNQCECNHDETISECKNFPNKVECHRTQVNNAVNMLKHFLWYKKIKMEEIQHLIKLTDNQIHDKLNFS